MARKKTSGVEALFDIAAALPWWAGVGMAIVAYVVCHSFATAEIPVATKLNEFGQFAGQSFIKVIASFAQYLLPIIFLSGAAASVFAQIKRRPSPPDKAEPTGYVPPKPPDTGTETNDPWPDPHEADTYPMRKSDSTQTATVDATRWSPELLRALEWKRFEEVCAGLFERLGFATKVATCGADGGIDIHLYRPPSEQPAAIVQCKARTGTAKIGVRVVRELFGVMNSEHVSEGILATTSTFSDEATEYARANHIDLMDGSAVLTSILTLTDEQQASLLRLVTAGDYTTPTCPSCGIKMKFKRPKAGGNPFWGCVNFPRCKSKINIAKR